MLTNLAIVEDDTILREELAHLFKSANYAVHEANQYDGLLDILRLHPTRLILLDLNLPGLDGYSIAQRLRESHPNIGIVMLTARTRIDDRIKGYHAGADIYLAKPVDPSELLAAIASLKRRIDGDTNGTGLTLEMRQKKLRNAKDQVVTLPTAEAMILRALTLAADGTTATGDLLDLLEQCFPERNISRRALENLISRLRHRTEELLGPDVHFIRSVRGVGYQLGCDIQLID